MIRHLMTLVLVSAVTVTSSTSIAGEPKPSSDSAILSAGAVLKEVWNEGSFTEGVAAGPDGMIYFSDIPFNENPGRVMKLNPKTGKVSVHCADSGKSNGLMFDANGRLIACCGAMHGRRALVEITPSGKVRPLVEKYKGKRLNSPNDLVVHPNGTIYFSDPRYAGDESVELDHMSVYRFNPADGSLLRVATNIEKPNGVHVSPDGKRLYVAETNNGSLDVRKKNPNLKPGRMTLNVFPIKKDGTLGKKKVLADFGSEVGTDGMSIDIEGNIYAAVRAASRHGIVVYSPQGKERAFIPTTALPTNCSFGIGDASKTLFVTAGEGLYRIRLNVAGFHPQRSK